MDIISVIDDDESVRVSTVDLLNSVGFACQAFASAEAYLRSEQARVTSCLILDISMPGMNGLDLQRRLAQDGISIPIIYITAYPAEATRSRALKAGAVCFLPKPYADEELLHCLKAALGGQPRPGASKDEGKP